MAQPLVCAGNEEQKEGEGGWEEAAFGFSVGKWSDKRWKTTRSLVTTSSSGLKGMCNKNSLNA